MRLLTASSAALAVSAGCFAALQPAAARTAHEVHQAPGARPNVILITTDDQDAASLAAMPKVRRLLAAQGTTFANTFSNYPLCSPSRTSLLTGQYAHNHRLLGNGEPDGPYEQLRNRETLPVWLSRAGYRTAHIGKYLHGYGVRQPREVPPGWAEWYGLTSRNAYYMWGYTLNENGRLRTYGRPAGGDPRLYQTDVLAKKAVGYLNRNAGQAKPFFLSLSTVAPHDEPPISGAPWEPWIPPRPAPRHKRAFAKAALPRTPSFNEADVRDKPRHIREVQRMGPAAIKTLTQSHRRRLASLQAIDDAVGGIVQTLQRKGALQRTLIIFTSDNGFMEGQHRLRNKLHPYEASIRVPLVMRGPGVPVDRTSTAPVGTPDLTATIMNAAGAQAGLPLDGRSVLGTHGPRWRDVLIETGPRPSGTRSYTAIRTDRYIYVEHTTGEVELYDLARDPDQLVSRHADPATIVLRHTLKQRLADLRRCAGRSCP